MMQDNPVLQRPIYPNRRRVSLFIDGSNLFYAARELEIYIDYRKLKDYLIGKLSPAGAYCYVGINPSQSQQRSFVSYLRCVGYQIIRKELVLFPDGTQKANLDVEMAVDMLEMSKAYDTAVLVTGDGDLACAVQTVQKKGKKVTVVGLETMTNYALKEIADRYIDLASIQNRVCQTFSYSNAA